MDVMLRIVDEDEDEEVSHDVALVLNEEMEVDDWSKFVIYATEAVDLAQQ